MRARRSRDGAKYGATMYWQSGAVEQAACLQLGLGRWGCRLETPAACSDAGCDAWPLRASGETLLQPLRPILGDRERGLLVGLESVARSVLLGAELDDPTVVRLGPALQYASLLHLVGVGHIYLHADRGIEHPRTALLHQGGRRRIGKRSADILRAVLQLR